MVQLTQIDDQIHVKVTEHVRLNSSKGVIIRCYCLKDMSDEEIIESFNDQSENLVKITAIHRVTRKVRDEIIETGTYFLTFGSAELPKIIYAGYSRYQVLPYIPQPMKCFQCLQYNHGKDSCQSPRICNNCAAEYHLSDDETVCNKLPKCVNCEQSHPSNSRDCPIFKKHQEIQRIKVIERVPFHQATRLYHERFPTFKTPSFADITKAKSCNCACNCGKVTETVKNVVPSTSSVQQIASPMTPGPSRSTSQANKRGMSAIRTSSSDSIKSDTKKSKGSRTIESKSGEKIKLPAKTPKTTRNSRKDDFQDDSESM